MTPIATHNSSPPPVKAIISPRRLVRENIQVAESMGYTFTYEKAYIGDLVELFFERNKPLQ